MGSPCYCLLCMRVLCTHCAEGDTHRIRCIELYDNRLLGDSVIQVQETKGRGGELTMGCGCKKQHAAAPKPKDTSKVATEKKDTSKEEDKK